MLEYAHAAIALDRAQRPQAAVEAAQQASSGSNRPSLPDLPAGLADEVRVLMTRYAMRAVDEALGHGELRGGFMPQVAEGSLSHETRLSLLNRLARNRGFENASKALESLPRAIESATQAVPAAVDSDMVLVPRELIEFLDGAAPLDGAWFGDDNPSGRIGRYWWRKNLKACAAAPVTSQADPEISTSTIAEQFLHGASQAVPGCIGNDPFCPCSDGDTCHYEGKNAWPVNRQEVPVAAPDDHDDLPPYPAEVLAWLDRIWPDSIHHRGQVFKCMRAYAREAVARAIASLPAPVVPAPEQLTPSQQHVLHGGWKCYFCGFDGQDNTLCNQFCSNCRRHK